MFDIIKRRPKTMKISFDNEQVALSHSEVLKHNGYSIDNWAVMVGTEKIVITYSDPRRRTPAIKRREEGGSDEWNGGRQTEQEQEGQRQDGEVIGQEVEG